MTKQKTTLVGLLLAATDVMTMTLYYPFYVTLISTDLGLKPQEAHGLATLLITFTAAAGVLLHLAVSMTRRYKDSSMPLFDQIVATTYVTAPLVLWSIQAILYASFMPNRMLGGMLGFFASIIETGLSFFAMQYLFGEDGVEPLPLPSPQQTSTHAMTGSARNDRKHPTHK